MREVISTSTERSSTANDAHAESWVDAFREHRYDVPFERIRPLIGMGGDRIIFALASTLRAPDAAEDHREDRLGNSQRLSRKAPSTGDKIALTVLSDKVRALV